MRRILVLRGGALGDFIVTLPALRLLRERWPTATIELVGNATAAQLGREAGLLDVVHSQHEARWASLHGSGPLTEPLARWLANFDLVVNFWPDPDGDLQRRFPPTPSQVYLVGDAMPSISPAAAHYCEPLRQLGLATTRYWQDLSALGATAYDTREKNARAKAKRVSIHPGSGSPRKNWPLEHWGELARLLAATEGIEIHVIAGEAESLEKLAALGLPARALPLREMIGPLADSDLFIGHDSGVSHVAAALGIPCVLLFGPTSAAMWAPPAPHVRVIQRGAALAGISVAEVQFAAEEALSGRR